MILSAIFGRTIAGEGSLTARTYCSQITLQNFILASGGTSEHIPECLRSMVQKKVVWFRVEGKSIAKFCFG
jgi:hypothetical protein